MTADDRRARRFAFDSGERQTGLTWEAIRRDHQARYEYACAAVHRRLEHPPGGGADIFCGGGYGTRRLSDALRCPVLGIDASAESVALAEQHFGNAGTIFAAKLFPFRLPERAFDFIAALESIEHVEDDAGFLSTLAGALKPGGVLVLSTPNEDRIAHDPEMNPFHVRCYLPEDVRRMLVQHGLRLCEQRGQDVYVMEGRRPVDMLPSTEMDVREMDNGQFLIFTARKE